MNGISYDKLHSGVGLTVTQLEVFFFGFPRVVGMGNFPNLTRLCIMNQDIGSMAGLQTCRHLEELWICEGGISVRRWAEFNRVWSSGRRSVGVA